VVKLPRLGTRSDLKPLRVLIAEDSQNDALLLLRELRRGGYEPEHERVDTPEAMEEALARSGWDVILSDYRMPRFGAPEALTIFRESGLEAPFIVVSGKVGEDAAVEAMKAGAHDYVMKDNLARLCATVERGLEEAEEHRKRRRAETELRRRDAILEAVGFAAERFLGEAVGWEESIEAVLEHLGVAAGVSRVYIFENYVGEDGEMWATQRYEWVAPGVSAQIENPLLKALPYRASGFGRWMEVLGRGELVYGHTREFPESERTELRAQDILSIVVVPIFVQGEWWGFLGFDECLAEHEWFDAEMDALKAAASTLGAAIRRRRADIALHESEERYSLVVEGSNDGIFDWDVRTGDLYWNNRLYEMFGLSRAEVSPTFELFAKLLHPEDRKRVLDAVTAHLERGASYNEEFRLRRPSGDYVYCVTRGKAQRDHSGVPVRMAGAVTDITERKHAEEALKESEERYRVVAETASDAIVMIDEDSKVLFVNSATEVIFGYSKAEMLGNKITRLMPERLRRVHEAALKRYLETSERRLAWDSIHLIGLHKSGREIPLEVSFGEYTEQGKHFFTGFVRDVTERKKAEEKLRSSEAELRALFEAITDAIFVFDSEGRYLKVAPSNPSLLYRPAEELLGKTLHEILPRGQADEFLGYIRRALETRHSVYHEYGLRIDGRQVWFEATISPMMEDLVVAVARDVTERKKAEEALRQSERLYRTVIEQVTENICLVDVETRRIVGSNPAFRETLGYTAGELERMTLYDIVAHDRESIDQNIRRTLETGRSLVGQRKYRRKDGTLLDVEASGSVILRNGRETICVVAHDVTERARMQELLEERVATLSAIAARVTLDLPMEDMLDALAEGVVKASTAVACSLVLADEGTDSLYPVGSYGLPEGYAASLQEAFRSGVQSPTLEAARTRQPVLVRDVRQFILSEPRYAPIHRFVRQVPWDTVYILPLVSRGRALGAINLRYLPGQGPGEDERSFLRAVADQAAVAVENARLFTQARGKAALEERQRLARELHDSVSQALYGIVLGVKTARALLDRDPNQAAPPLEYVLSLAEAGTAEMKALIFELRPESLEKEGLVAALEKQAAALRARHEIEVEADLCDEPDVPLEVKEDIYRIAQEVLHNTVKHARASKVGISMRCSSEHITLDILDDGIGFDARGEFPGHLGLRSMRERAGRLGGTLEVDSAPEEGTRVRASIPFRVAPYA
jgi:PAS domain S-box-containing protein